MAFLWKRDEDARQRAMARISREQTLGALKVRLAGKTPATRLEALRGFARVVIVAGPAVHLAEAADAAAPHKQALLERGVVFVPFATDGAEAAQVAEGRWLATPLAPAEWTRWLRDQMGAAGVPTGSGVYVSLRMDGRVRASGVGLPPWGLLAASLPPTTGFFAGFLDGMDGRVGPE